MKYEKLALFISLPAMLLGQDSQLSGAAQKLLNKPQLGSAQLTWSDGRKQTGRIVRVTDQFIAFKTDTKPEACENVELSKVAALQWLPTAGGVGAATHVAEVAFVGALLAPFFAASAVANPFKRISPPLKPLRGSWEVSGPSRGALKSSLEFKGDTVHSRTMTVRRGRWWVEHDRLHLKFDGEPESVAHFSFACGELVLDNSLNTFREQSDRNRATAPIVGNWAASNHDLHLKPDGRATEQKWEDRNGTFENSTTRVSMHWADSIGPGGAEWIAEIKNRHILVNVGGVLTVYHYVPPGFYVDDL